MQATSRLVKRAFGAAAVLAAVWIAWALAGLPPRAIGVAPSAGDRLPSTARGVYHVHSRESDGTGTVQEIAAAAERAGLQFVVLTDHQDASRPSRLPRYFGSVLVVEAAEISAVPGHYVALGIPQAPYPLAGEARDVVDDVRRLGGFGVAAHPDSPREGLRWFDWNAPIDGLEWFNADSQWRAEPVLRLLRAIPQYPIRPAETVASMFARPDATLRRWDSLTAARRIVGLAASDAHARLGIGGGSDPYEGGLTIPAPSYEAVFRALSLTVELDAAFTRDAGTDASRLLSAIRAGHVYAVADGFGTPGRLRFEARSGAATAREGDILPIRGPVSLRAECELPPGSTMTLIRNGSPVLTTEGPVLDWTVRDAEDGGSLRGTFRVEVHIADHTGADAMPWIVSNPIYVGLEELRPAPPAAAPAPFEVERLGSGTEWKIEKDATSEGTVASEMVGPVVRRTFRLTLGNAASPFVAAVTPEIAPFRRAARIVFTGSADRPLRISVQLRAPSPGDDQRWWRSIYLDTNAREVVVPLDDLRPVGPRAVSALDRARIDTMLFVVDSTNARPGMSATIRLDDIRVER
jgi:hypothetical protein